MKGPVGFGRMVNLVMNVVMGLSISLVVLACVHVQITPDVVIQSWFCSFVIGYAFGDLVPIANAGPALCAKLGVRSGASLYVVSSVCLALYFGTVILLGMSIINNLPSGGWATVLGFFASMWPAVAVAAIVFVLVFLAPAQRIASAASGFNPAA